VTKQSFYLLITSPRLNNYESKILIVSQFTRKKGVSELMPCDGIIHRLGNTIMFLLGKTEKILFSIMNLY